MSRLPFWAEDTFFDLDRDSILKISIQECKTVPDANNFLKVINGLSVTTNRTGYIMVTHLDEKRQSIFFLKDEQGKNLIARLSRI